MLYTIFNIYIFRERERERERDLYKHKDNFNNIEMKGQSFKNQNIKICFYI